MLQTERLTLSRLTCDDAAFILDLLNEPSFKKHIGDKGVRTLEDARDYLRDGPIDQYETSVSACTASDFAAAKSPWAFAGSSRAKGFRTRIWVSRS